MKFTKVNIKGVYIMEPSPVADNRGSFSRIFCEKELHEIGHRDHIVQINHSMNKEQGTLRGLHYQLMPASEIKIVKCIKGAIFDVVVDVRRGSDTFLSWYGQELTEKNMKLMYIPKGFAHGFQTLKPNSEIIYFSSEFYTPEKERGLNYKDPALDIQWPMPVSCISERDSSHAFIKKGHKGVRV